MTDSPSPKNEAEDVCLAYFLECIPKFASFPHVVLRPDERIPDAIIIITGSVPGPWPAEPVYDAVGNYVLGDEPALPLSEWANPFNQAELARRFRGGGDFATNSRVVLDCHLDDAVVNALLPEDAIFERDDIWWLIPKTISQLRWIVVPVSPDFDFVLFVCDSEHAEWTSKLRRWANDREFETTVVHSVGETVQFEGFFADFPLKRGN